MVLIVSGHSVDDLSIYCMMYKYRHILFLCAYSFFCAVYLHSYDWQADSFICCVVNMPDCITVLVFPFFSSHTSDR